MKERIEDFGELIPGAAKHLAGRRAALADELAAKADGDTLNEIWPAPDYDRLVTDGLPERGGALIHALRDEIGTAPKRYGRARWRANAETCRGLAGHVVRCETDADVDRILDRIDTRLAEPGADTARRLRFLTHLYANHGHKARDRGHDPHRGGARG